MSSLDEYQNLGKDLAGYVKEVRTNSGAPGLQEAFKSGGKLFDVMQMLDQKEKLIRNYDEQLLTAFDPANPGEITRDYVNKRTAENEIELAEIKLLKDRLGDFSSAVGQKTSGFAMTRAVNEFSEGIEKHEKVSKGFFSTLTSFIGNIFKGKDEQKLTQASSNLDNRTSAISNESQERFSIPGKGKESPEIPQPEQVIQKGMSSQSLGEISSPSMTKVNVGDMPLPPPINLADLPPPPPFNVGDMPLPPPINLADLPPPPPFNVGDIPLPPPINLTDLPPPPPFNVGDTPLPPPINLTDLPPPPPFNVTDLPPPPPPPMPKVGSGIPTPPPMKPPSQTVTEVEGMKKPPTQTVFDELIERANRKKKVSLNHPNYEHVSTEPKVRIVSEEGMVGELKERIGKGSEELPIEQKLLNGASKKDQQNILYSAMINNNDQLVADLLKHQSDFNTGVQDDWDMDIIEKRSTFSEEQIETVRKAVEETKLRVAAGIDLAPVKEDPKPITITPKVQEQNPSTTTVTVEGIPPPPMHEVGSGVKKPPSPTVGEVKPVVPDTGALLDQIRKGGVKLKTTGLSSQNQSLNSEGFT